MAALPLEALARIKDLEERLEDVKFHVRALQQVAAGQVAAVGAAERCRLRLSLAFGITSLFYGLISFPLHIIPYGTLIFV